MTDPIRLWRRHLHQFTSHLDKSVQGNEEFLALPVAEFVACVVSEAERDFLSAAIEMHRLNRAADQVVCASLGNGSIMSDRLEACLDARRVASKAAQRFGECYEKMMAAPKLGEVSRGV